MFYKLFSNNSQLLNPTPTPQNKQKKNSQHNRAVGGGKLMTSRGSHNINHLTAAKQHGGNTFLNCFFCMDSLWVSDNKSPSVVVFHIVCIVTIT